MNARFSFAQWRAATASDRLLNRARDVLTDAIDHVDDPRVHAWLLLDEGGAWSAHAVRILSSSTLADDARAAGRTVDAHAAILVANDANAVANDVSDAVVANLRSFIARHTGGLQ